MQWSENLEDYIQQLTPVKINSAIVQKIVSLMDLTSLNKHDTENHIALFSEKAFTPFGHVAALCVCPQFVRMLAASFIGKPVKIATVANFPEGTDPLEKVLVDIGRALEDGAQEIDVVFPYRRYLAGEKESAWQFVEACKSACGEEVKLKVILETGMLKERKNIADASYDAISAGADFIKTSTGKIHEGATLEAAATMLMVIKEATPKLNKKIGIKFSGGIREAQPAALYLELAEKIMGSSFLHPSTCRIGSSKLLDELLKLEVA